MPSPLAQLDAARRAQTAARAAATPPAGLEGGVLVRFHWNAFGVSIRASRDRGKTFDEVEFQRWRAFPTTAYARIKEVHCTQQQEAAFLAHLDSKGVPYAVDRTPFDPDDYAAGGDGYPCARRAQVYNAGLAA